MGAQQVSKHRGEAAPSCFQAARHVSNAVLQAAILFRSSVNLVQISEERREQLSTGVFVLADVTCRCCNTLLGWRYLSSENEVRLKRQQ